MSKKFVIKMDKRMADRLIQDGAKTRVNKKGNTEVYHTDRFGDGSWWEVE